MFTRFLMAIAALLLPAQVFAQDLEGHWALQIDDATIFVFALDREEDGDWSGSWTRPENIDSNGAVFRRMSGSETVTPIETQQAGEVVRLTFAGPEGRAQNDVLRFALLDENRAELLYQGIPGDPYPLVRVVPGTPLGPFEPARIYDRDNAVTEADYDPEALPPEPASDENEDDEESPRIEADFLDGL
ncbi:hypothetical protein [Aurantiacibacter poecillastricola]|uniref:hypothetical protein n=1 Tax=Aurantiacibacter poecillastricola TaxID=3064385 RepID=UPI00273D958D|nr:hypothetical protein [Aurantiacibacter sp. 219JJ12-13]MDP5260084.1 hypothetical protein [Aurantiacibacter sp. 219JJ12-13]